MKNKIITIIVIGVIAILVIIAIVNKLINKEGKTECKIIDGEKICGKEVKTEKGTEKVYTAEDGKVQVTERYDDTGSLKQTEKKTTSEDRECIEIREPGETMPMMVGCRPRNQ